MQALGCWINACVKDGNDHASAVCTWVVLVVVRVWASVCVALGGHTFRKRCAPISSLGMHPAKALSAGLPCGCAVRCIVGGVSGGNAVPGSRMVAMTGKPRRLWPRDLVRMCL